MGACEHQRLIAEPGADDWEVTHICLDCGERLTHRAPDESPQPSLLHQFRSLCGRIAFARDHGLCQACRHLDGMPFPAAESHHVLFRSYGDDWLKEHWLLRLTLCQRHHQQFHHIGGLNRPQLIWTLFCANAMPVMLNWDAAEIETILAHGNGALLKLLRELRDPAIAELKRSMEKYDVAVGNLKITWLVDITDGTRY